VTRVLIRAIAAGGDGVGTLDDGKTVFVPRSAPGDTAEIAIVEQRARFARGRLVALLERGPERTEPDCPHYVEDECGGCQLQHLDYPAQLAAKGRVVGDALRRIGRLELDADPDVVPAPEPWRYRARVTLGAALGRIGYHPLGTPAHVFDLRDCHIARTRLMDLWRAVSRHRPLLPDRLASLGLREDREGGSHVVAVTDDQRAWDAAPLARALGQEGVTLWWRPHGGAARAVAGAQGAYPVLAFEQVHPAFGARIRDQAVSALGPVNGQRVWDLYAGTGETARALSDAGADVTAVEIDRSAVAWGIASTRNASGKGDVTWRRGRVEDEAVALPDPEAVVANPPRTGLARVVAERLDMLASSGRLTRLAYLSCDAATLARDVRRLPHLKLARLTAYDLFPQTAHVETLALLEAA
jgi:23S rRNA (uracil1939-C5)-methyltransferase